MTEEIDDTEEKENEELYWNTYSKRMSELLDRPIAPVEPETPLPDHDFALPRAEKNYEEGLYLAQGGGVHPNANIAEKQFHKKITPDEAEEQGIVGDFVDGVSDFTLGAIAGTGYGVDELAVSFSKISNMLVPDFIDGGNEYEGRYLSEYVDAAMKARSLHGNGVAEAGRSIAQFMLGWIPLVRGVKYAALSAKGVKGLKKAGEYVEGVVPTNIIASALTGAAAFSPAHKNIGNDLQTVDNYLAGAVSRALATDPNDPEWKNRLRNAMQEGGLAIAGDKILMPLVKGAAGAIGAAGKAVGEGMGSVMESQYIAPVHEKFIEMLGLVKASTRGEAAKRLGIRANSRTVASIKDGKVEIRPNKQRLDDEAAELGSVPEPHKGTEFLEIEVPKGKSASAVIEAMDSSGELGKRFASAETLDDKWAVANDVARLLKEDKSKTSVKKWLDSGKEIFEEYQLSPATVKAINEGTALNGEQIFAVAHVARSTADDLVKAIKEVETIGVTLGDLVDSEAMDIAQSNFLKKLVDYIDIANISDEIASQAGKSLRAVRALKENPLGAGVSRDILSMDNMTDMLKHTNFAGSDITRIAAMLNQSLVVRGHKGLVGAVKEGTSGGFWKKNMNMFVEGWVNQGLLSNPATHMLNMFTGAANIATHVGSQFIAAGLSKIPFAGKLLGTEDVMFREAWGSLYGIMAGLGKAFQLAHRASVTGRSAFGSSTKIDNYGFQHIAAKTVDMEGTGIGLGLDYMGSLTRSSGRFLLMEDEFVKTIASEMKKHSLAWKYAFANGTRSKGAKTLYKDIIDHPELFTERMAGVDLPFDQQMKELADLVTFQQKSGTLANGLSKATTELPVLKLGVPFIKVLTNIPKFAVRHSPAGLLFRTEEFKRGGASRMLELGRMSYGTLMMLYGAHMYGRGDMTGSGPRSYWRDRDKKELGVSPARSIKIKSPYARADQKYWVDIGRFAPYSTLLQMGGDIQAIRQASGDMPIPEIVEKMLTSVQKNIVDPTWAPSLHKIVGVLADSSSEPGDWERAIKSIVGTFQPSFVRAHNKAKNPFKKQLKTFHSNPMSAVNHQPEDYSSYMAQIFSVTPGMSDLIPNANNIFGDEVKYERGLEDGLPALLTDPSWSFLQIRKADETPSLKYAMEELEVSFSRPVDKFNVGRSKKIPVQLTPFEYKEFTRRIGKGKNRYGENLKEALESMYNSVGFNNLRKKYEATGDVHAQKDMAESIEGVYNSAVRRARYSMLSDPKFKMNSRAMALLEKFGD